MSMTGKDLLDLLYNKKLPQIYRDEDKKIDYPLKRYLESLIYGGFCGSIEDIEGVMLLVDPESIPEEYLPYLYDSFGLEYQPNIDVTYYRKFLLNIGELTKRKGTFASVRYLAKALTGLEAEITYNKEDSTLEIVLLARTLSQIENLENSTIAVRNFVKNQVPFFVNPVISSRIDAQVIPSKSYSHSAVGSYSKFYNINTGGN